MTLIELKSVLKEEIERTDDIEKLEMYKILLDNINSKVPELNEWQKNRIIESKQQIKEGKYYTNEQVNEIIDKWFEGK